MAFIVLSGTAGGSSTVAGALGMRMLFSGRARGQGEVLDGLLLSASGTAAGTGDLRGTSLRRLSFRGTATGIGSAVLSMPLPAQGVSSLTAYVEVARVGSVCCPASCHQATFRWGHIFERGDLPLCVVDSSQNPVGPARVSYTLYQVVRGYQLQRIGPENRSPATAYLGEYYVTGFAGDGGQPGCWLVRWRYQISFGSPPIEKDTRFRVVDSVLSPIPGDTTLRRWCKRGWD